MTMDEKEEVEILREENKELKRKIELMREILENSKAFKDERESSLSRWIV